MKPYRNGKTFQARAAGGQFRQWSLDGDFGVSTCPWCHRRERRIATELLWLGEDDDGRP